jgi:flavin reductase (DIM6/NTAB) family NADH-FMN oxidoreductase RutF
MLTVLVGALVDDKPNYITIAHVGIMTPQSVSLGVHKSHYTNRGIIKHECFSVNVPSEDMVKVTDYCGLVSGKKTDKSGLFNHFFGDLGKAPMIEECPLNMECKLIEYVDMNTHDIFIGEVMGAYCKDDYLTDGKVDLSKIRPILFAMNDKSYWKLGERLGKAWGEGKPMLKE